MGVKNGTLWPIEPHTRAKHGILTYYLKAWFPIILSGPARRVLYIDGFAGPGEYAGGEDGSPVLALKVALNHSLRPKFIGKELVFLFIEEQDARFANLEQKLEGMKQEIPSNFKVERRHGTFESEAGEILDRLEKQNKSLAPSFVFIDPFGPTGFPMSLMDRFARQPKAEVLVNFGYQSLNQRFLSDSSKHARLTELFGDSRWQQASQISDPRLKEDFLVEQYQWALQERGWRGTKFRLINKHNQTQYYLLYGTNNYRGMLAMKSALWHVAPDGDFQYSDVSDPNQLRLFTTEFDPQYAQELASQIFEKRQGTTATKESIVQNELAWHSTYIKRHLSQALRLLESECSPPKIVNVRKRDGSTRLANTYPDGCTITFSG